MIGLAIGALACLAWMYLLLARGGFWRVAPTGVAPQAPVDIAAWPRVTAVIPARDEASTIGAGLDSLLRQRYPGALSLIVVDDHSSDGTADVVRATMAHAHSSLSLVVAPELPPGWTGKLWALEQGIRHAESAPHAPDFLLLTDADIVYAPGALSALVARAIRDDRVLVSLMAKLHCKTPAERAAVPAFIFFFRMLYPFAWVNRAQCASAAAAGGCMLVRASALRAVGGVASIRGELIDDCALARLLKRVGPIWLGLACGVDSTRTCRSLADVRRMIVRCAYTQLRCSAWWLAGTIAAMTVVFIAPPFLALAGDGATRLLAVLAWLVMAAAFQPTLHYYRLSPLWGVALPAIAAGYLLLTLDSARLHHRGRGGEWKGRYLAHAMNPASRLRK